MTGCRRPDKIKYVTRKLARRAACDARMRYGGPRLSAYLCDCGSYHVGRLNEYVVAGYSLDRWDRPQAQP